MNYALIGCGRIATNHIKAAVNNKLNIVAVCDILPEAMENLLAKHGLENDKSIKRYTDYKQMLAENDITLQQIGVASTLVHGDQINLCSPMQMIVRAEQGSEIPMLTALYVGEETMVDADRPSVVLCKADTASLWELAKRFGSTIEAIRLANNLEQNPEQNQLLLIPIM